MRQASPDEQRSDILISGVNDRSVSIQKQLVVLTQLLNTGLRAEQVSDFLTPASGELTS